MSGLKGWWGYFALRTKKGYLAVTGKGEEVQLGKGNPGKNEDKIFEFHRGGKWLNDKTLKLLFC